MRLRVAPKSANVCVCVPYWPATTKTKVWAVKQRKWKLLWQNQSN